MRIEPRTPELQTVNINWVTELHIIDAKTNKINLPFKSTVNNLHQNVSVWRHLLGITVVNSNPFWSTYTCFSWSTGTYPKSSRTQLVHINGLPRAYDNFCYDGSGSSQSRHSKNYHRLSGVRLYGLIGYEMTLDRYQLTKKNRYKLTKMGLSWLQ